MRLDLTVPISFLEISAQNDCAIRERSRNDIRLIVFSMTHDILRYLRCLDEDDLPSGGIAFGVVHTGERDRRVADTVEDDLRRR